MKLFERISIVFRAMFSRNIILIYDIKQQIKGGKLNMISKTQRHTNFSKFEDIEVIENTIEKIIKKC
jgi:hypothetical protein